MRRMRWILCAILGMAVAGAAEETKGKTLCVDAGSRAGAPDGSPGRPFAKVQQAVDAVASGDTVKVAAGVYAENVRVAKKTVHLLGGFAGATPETYAAGREGDFTTRDPGKQVTALRGDSTVAVVKMEDCGPSTLDGFTITGGLQGVWVGGWPAEKTEPTISHNLIEKNGTTLTAEMDLKKMPNGGGVWLCAVSGIIRNNVIRNNTGNRGAGVAAHGPSIRVEGNVVEGNVGMGDHGGGIYVASPRAIIGHNLVRGNFIGRKVGYGWGAGIIVFGKGTVATLACNVVTGNDTPKGPTGTFIDDGAEAVLDHELICDSGWLYVDAGPATKATLVNCTVVQTKPVNAHAIEVTGKDTTVVVKNCILWGFAEAVRVWEKGSSLTIRSSLVPDKVKSAFSAGAVEVTGAVLGDPLFADPANFDFHLKSRAGRWNPKAADGKGDWVMDDVTSPGVDAGDPASDFSKEPAPNGGRINLGCYGGTPEASRSPAGR